MSNLDFITTILHLPQDSITFTPPNQFQLTLPVVPHTCPHCQQQTSRVHDYRRQPVHTTALLDSPVSLFYRKRRYWCPHCGKAFAEHNPIVSRYQRMTRDMIAQIIAAHGTLISSADIARRYKVSTSTVQRLFQKVSPISWQMDEVISIDEFKGDTGAKFQVVINSLSKRRCLNILEDRSREILYAKILEYPLKERLKVKLVSIDLSASFRCMLQACFPNAALTADKFHTVRMANDALNTIRKNVQEQLPKEQRIYFKRSKYLLLRRDKNLIKEEDRTALQVMLNYSDRLSAAYAMKEAYFDLMDSKDSKAFTRKLKSFQMAVEKQELKPFLTLLKTTLRWKKEIIHAIATGYNNGFTEGCNTTIKNLKRLAYGFRNFDNFKRRILYLLNNPARCSLRKGSRKAEICA